MEGEHQANFFVTQICCILSQSSERPSLSTGTKIITQIGLKLWGFEMGPVEEGQRPKKCLNLAKLPDLDTWMIIKRPPAPNMLLPPFIYNNILNITHLCNAI